MFDLVLGGILVFAVVRGWMRGFTRSVVGLIVVVLGSVLALRLSGPAGTVVSGIAGTSPSTSRVIGGVAVFLMCSVAGLVVARMMHHVLDAMPGLPTLDRAAGAAVAGLAGVLVVTLLVSAVRVLPLGTLGAQVEASEL
ncbi:MAG: CvpA family protein, partial [Actinobacteria bacterium]|nr:CvpA family protein [Actinomycetota bacterium]